PSVHPSEEGLSSDAENGFEFLPHHACDRIITHGEHLFRDAPPDKAAQERPICRSTEPKFVMHKGPCENLSALGSWDKKTESLGQRGADGLVIAKHHRDR